MNLTQAEEEMMRNKMCEADGGFWCNATVDYDQINSFGFPGVHGHNAKYKHHQTRHIVAVQSDDEEDLVQPPIQKLMQKPTVNPVTGEKISVPKPVALKKADQDKKVKEELSKMKPKPKPQPKPV